MSDEDRPSPTAMVAAMTAAIVFLSLAWIAVRWSSLPDPVATHWNVLGEADGRVPRWVLVFIVLALGAAAVGGAVSAVVHPSPASKVSAFVGVLLAGFAMTIAVAVVDANVGIERWQDAPPSTAIFVVGLAGSLVVASLAARSVPVVHPVRHTRRQPTPNAPMARSFTGDASNGWTLVVAGVLLLAGPVVFGAAPLVAVPLVTAAVVVGVFAHITVRVDASVMEIRFSPWRYPRLVVPIADIRSVSVVDCHPMQYGGWGYRGSLRLFGWAVVVIRSGPAVSLDLVGDRTLLVTVDHADDAAAILADNMVASSE